MSAALFLVFAAAMAGAAIPHAVALPDQLRTRDLRGAAANAAAAVIATAVSANFFVEALS